MSFQTLRRYLITVTVLFIISLITLFFIASQYWIMVLIAFVSISVIIFFLIPTPVRGLRRGNKGKAKY